MINQFHTIRFGISSWNMTSVDTFYYTQARKCTQNNINTLARVKAGLYCIVTITLHIS